VSVTLVALVALWWLALIGYLLRYVALSVPTIRILARHTGGAAVVMVEGLSLDGPCRPVR